MHNFPWSILGRVGSKVYDDIYSLERRQYSVKVCTVCDKRVEACDWTNVHAANLVFSR